MTSAFFFDEILQIFLSDGNFHILLGSVSGDTSPDGKDLRVPVAKLIVPQGRLVNLLPQLEQAVSQLTNQEISATQAHNEIAQSPRDVEGKISSFDV